MELFSSTVISSVSSIQDGINRIKEKKLRDVLKKVQLII